MAQINLPRWKPAVLLLLLVGIFYLVAISTSGINFNTSAPRSKEEQIDLPLETYLDEESLENTSQIYYEDTYDLKEPNREYEMTRHRLHEQIRDLSKFVSEELKSAIAETDNNKRNTTLKDLLTNLKNRESMLLVEQQRLAKVDGHAERRAREASDLSELVQRRLRSIQNPPDCSAAKKIICDLNLYCGFGCQVHHVVYCLRAAYATQRTLILASRRWSYTPSWDSLFEPISDNCYDITFDKKKAVPWPGSENDQLILLEDRIYAPLGVPKDLAFRIMSFNGDPGAWFTGQILKYILRPRVEFQKSIDDTIARIHYRHPVVGIQIRRTDKLIWEAKLHHVHEYMQEAENYWERLDLQKKPGEPRTPRRVYLACDDVSVFEEAQQKFPSVEFLGDKDIARIADTKNRWSLPALTGLLVDLLLLSRSDYLVCTFSSNVGRAAYELMQSNRVDASESVFSVDLEYNFFGSYAPHNNITKETQWLLLPRFSAEKVPILYNYSEYKQVLPSSDKPASTNTKTDQIT